MRWWIAHAAIVARGSREKGYHRISAGCPASELCSLCYNRGMTNADQFLAIYQANRWLFEKGARHTLSTAEHDALLAAARTLRSLARGLRIRLVSFDPDIDESIKAAEIFATHYRRKAELDEKFFQTP
jgi:hypothetical protein